MRCLTSIAKPEHRFLYNIIAVSFSPFFYGPCGLFLFYVCIFLNKLFSSDNASYQAHFEILQILQGKFNEEKLLAQFLGDEPYYNLQLLP